MLSSRCLVFRRCNGVIVCELCGMPRYEEEKRVAKVWIVEYA